MTEKRGPGRGREKGIAKERNFIFFSNGENITVQTEQHSAMSLVLSGT